LTFPKISIITPSFQQGAYLEKTIQSVLNQQYPNLEYLIFDAGSSDETLSILKKYDTQIDFWISEPDNGQSHAINKGLQKATGEIVAWLNSDDQFTEETLIKIGDYFSKNPEVYLVHGATLLFGEKMLETKRSAPKKDLEILYLACLPYPQPSAFFRHETIEKFGFLNQNLHYGMDYDFFVQIALNYKIEKIEGVFSKYLMHPSSKTVSQNSGFAKDYAQVFSKILRSFSSENTQDLIREMTNLGLYHEANDTYQVSKKYTKNELQKAFLYNLKYQLSFYYEDLDLETCRKITNFLKGFAPDFVAEFPEILQINQRSKWLNKPLMQLLRKVRR